MKAKPTTSERTSKEADELLSFLDKLWAQKGYSRPASRAPLEHVASLPAGKIGNDLCQASRNAVEYFYSISYGHAQPVREVLQNLRRTLEKAGAV
jgi:hypothetical protein